MCAGSAGYTAARSVHISLGVFRKLAAQSVIFVSAMYSLSLLQRANLLSSRSL